MGCYFPLQCMKVISESEVAQSCPTLSDPMDCSLWGSSTHGTSQARVLEWVAIDVSLGFVIHVIFYHIFLDKYENVGLWFVVVHSLSHVNLCDSWTIAHQALLSMGFPRQEYWSGWPFPSPGDLPDPGIKSMFLALAGRFFVMESPDRC